MRCSLERRLTVAIVLAFIVSMTLWVAWHAQRMLRPDAGYWDEGLGSFSNYVLGSLPPDPALLGQIAQRQRTEAKPDDPAARVKGTVFQVWSNTGELLIRSPQAPGVPLRPVVSGAGRIFETTQAAGQIWRVGTTWHPNGLIQLQVAMPSFEMRDNLLKDIRTSAPGALLLFVALSLGVWIAVRWSFAPLKAMRREVEQRADGDWRPLEPGRLPDELKPMIGTFNLLLARLSSALRNERRFLSNAAHELRTPLAALRAQAQVAQRASTEPAVQSALGKLTASIDRTTRLAEQLLALARSDALSANAEGARPMALDALVHMIAGEFTDAARNNNLRLTVRTQPVQVVGQQESIGIVLRNLIDNALRYTPAGGAVSVRCESQEQWAVLSISDTGPGIPETERELVFERFYRGEGTLQPGSGLGLSIVKETVAQQRGSVSVYSPPAGAPHGLEVLVRLPLKAA